MSWMILMVMLVVLFARPEQIFSQEETGAEDQAKSQPSSQNSDGEVDLLDMSIEDLMNIEITSVSKKQEKRFEIPAAVHVITQEDIRRSGATSIPEALRMVPGLQVARINSSIWAISARGFNSELSNKLLVMIDGRSIYTLTFAGIYWDVQDVMLADVERIEVIRGPGGTLWGANAVNGIINIITKNARDSQGFLVTGGGGTQEQGFGAVRYGGKLGENTFFRVYTKYFNRDDGVDAAGRDGADEWDYLQGGFRLDWDASDSDKLTLQGDIYSSQFNKELLTPTLVPPFEDREIKGSDLRGGNVLGRWTHNFSERSDMTWQFYYDRGSRKNFTYGLSEIRDTFDFDTQHRFWWGNRQEIVWGLGYRFTTDNIESSEQAIFNPENRDLYFYSGFVQDEITLVDDHLKLIVGSKFEHNDYTGFEYQPSGRLLWTPHERHTVWTAVTRAVRTPSRVDREIQALIPTQPGPGGMPVKTTAIGNDGFDAEEVYAYELGYRVQPAESIFLDFSTFFNRYDNLVSYELGAATFVPAPVPHLDIPLYFDNKMDGETYGVEAAANWNVTDQWRLTAGYSFIQMHLHPDNSSTDTVNSTDIEGNTPHNQFHLRSYLDLPGNLELDTALYYVENVPTLEIPSYLRLDARLGWHINENMELSLVAQNLLDGQHPEFSTWGEASTETERSFYARLTWRF